MSDNAAKLTADLAKLQADWVGQRPLDRYKTTLHENLKRFQTRPKMGGVKTSQTAYTHLAVQARYYQLWKCLETAGKHPSDGVYAIASLLSIRKIIRYTPETVEAAWQQNLLIGFGESVKSATSEDIIQNMLEFQRNRQHARATSRRGIPPITSTPPGVGSDDPPVTEVTINSSEEIDSIFADFIGPPMKISANIIASVVPFLGNGNLELKDGQYWLQIPVSGNIVSHIQALQSAAKQAILDNVNLAIEVGFQQAEKQHAHSGSPTDTEAIQALKNEACNAASNFILSIEDII